MLCVRVTSKSSRGWLCYLTGNLPVAMALGLPPGVLIAFGPSALGAPLWPSVLLAPIAALATVISHQFISGLERRRRALDIALGALLGVTIALLEAPWRASYDASTFWRHALGIGLGGSLTGLLMVIGYTLAAKLEKRGPFTKVVRGGAAIMGVVLIPVGFFGGGILAAFSLVLWTTDVAELGPSFLPTSVFITGVTALSFALLAWPLSWVLQPRDGRYSSASSASSVS